MIMIKSACPRFRLSPFFPPAIISSFLLLGFATKIASAIFLLHFFPAFLDDFRVALKREFFI